PVVDSGNGTGRADRHQIARQQGMDAFFFEGGDLAAVAAIRDADLRVAVDLFHEPHAPRAENAAVAIQHQRRTEVDVGFHAFAVEYAARELHPALRGSEAVREILERTVPPLV